MSGKIIEFTRPLMTPRTLDFVREPRVDPEHDAVRLWRELSPSAPTPTYIERLPMGSRRRKSEIFRLGGTGPDRAPIIAKRERPEVVARERLVYEEILPPLGLPSLEYFGAFEGDEASWIFIEDAAGEPFSEADAIHRATAARWMGALHIASSARGEFAERLPDQGPDRYLDHLNRAREMILATTGNPELRRDDGVVLEAVLRHFDELTATWSEIREFCEAVPGCLVHGDFVGKNARIRFDASGPTLVLMDWETAGWGAPAPDVMRLDPRLYRAAISESWPEVGMREILELARIGTIFRAIAAIDWDARMLRFTWVDGALRNIRGYEGWLTLARRGTPYRVGSVGL